jgi:hypothetical protein
MLDAFSGHPYLSVASQNSGRHARTFDQQTSTDALRGILVKMTQPPSSVYEENDDESARILADARGLLGQCGLLSSVADGGYRQAGST